MRVGASMPERAECAAVAALAMLALCCWMLQRAGAPVPLLPEPLWVRASLGTLRWSLMALVAAIGLSIVALMLPRGRHRLARSGLTVGWVAFALVTWWFSGETIAAVVRTVINHV